MITRPFQLHDIQGVASLLRSFIQDDISPDYLKGLPEYTVWVERAIITTFAPHSWVVEDKGEVVAVIIAHVGCMPLVPAAKVIEEMIFYVREDYRNTRAGAMLFKRWTRYAKKLRDDGEVEAVIMSTLAESPIDMEHHGFNLLQQTYIMED